MTLSIGERLERIERLFDAGLDPGSTATALALMGHPAPERLPLDEMRLYSELLPREAEMPFGPHRRALYFLWHTLDRLPIGLAVDFAIPFRRLVARRLFAACGRNFICEEGVSFNLPQNISVGDDVFFNRGCYLDAKGGIQIGDAVVLTEWVRIFTHGHSEAVHTRRSYAPVVIEDHAKVYTHATILPGVRVGRQACIATGAVVSHDVPPDHLVAGIPARVVRGRKSEGRQGAALCHTWLRDGAFQDEPAP